MVRSAFPPRRPADAPAPYSPLEDCAIIPVVVPPEFISELQDAFIRLGVATLGGALVGVNRELRGKPAGMRTHALVSLGAALVTFSSVYLAQHGIGGVPDSNAVTRTMQGIIAGVGFLGGGVILKTSDSRTVRHLTTAASLWVVACLGIVCGAGQWPLAGAALTLTLLVLVIGGPLEGSIRRAILGRIFRTDTTPVTRHTGEFRRYRTPPPAGSESTTDD